MPIPKLIHQIWIGPRSAPTAWMNTWKEKHPEYEFIFWNNDRLKNYQWDPIVRKFIDSYLSREQYHGAADVMSLQFLRDLGGFRAPADSRCLKSIDDLLSLEAFACFENEKHRPGLISPIIGITPRHPFMEYLVDQLKTTKPEDPAVRFVGNYYLTRCHDDFQSSKLKILPSRTFVPTWKRPASREEVKKFQDSGDVYATHEWGTTLGRFESGGAKSDCTVVSLYFTTEDNRFERLARVFKASLDAAMPRAQKIHIRTKKPAVIKGSTPYKAANTYKLGVWIEKLEEAKYPNVICMDVDLLVRDDISEVFSLPFDIAYTVGDKDGSPPFNLGVLFLKRNDRTRAFLKKWAEINDKMYRDRKFHRPYEKKYHGINQAAFGWMLENYKGEINLRKVSAGIYNCSNNKQWRKHQKAKIIHIKHTLREALFKPPIKRQRIVTSRQRKEKRRIRRMEAKGLPVVHQRTSRADYNEILEEWFRWEARIT